MSMKSTIIIGYLLLIEFISINGYSQKKSLSDSLKVFFVFSKSVILNSDDLTLQVVYKNNTNEYIEVYKLLNEGNKEDRFYNISIEAEKFTGTKYAAHPMRYYQNPLLYKMEDSLMHYDLPKKKLAPFSADTLKLNILEIARSFSPGKYRIKAYLRIKTIIDYSAYNDKNFETAPPMDKIEYLSSEWIYFVVKKYLSLKE